MADYGGAAVLAPRPTEGRTAWVGDDAADMMG